MRDHIVKAVRIIKASQEYDVLLNAINTGRICIRLGHPGNATIGLYLLRLLTNSPTLDRYNIYVNNVLVNTSNLPKEITDCINIPEVKALILKHRLGVSQ